MAIPGAHVNETWTSPRAVRFPVTLTESEARQLGLPPGGQGQLSPDSERITLTFRVWAPGLSSELECLGTISRTYLAI